MKDGITAPVDSIASKRLWSYGLDPSGIPQNIPTPAQTYKKEVFENKYKKPVLFYLLILHLVWIHCKHQFLINTENTLP